MIDKSSVVKVLMERLVSLPVGHAVDMRTYKRNRSVVFVRDGRDVYRIVEQGFESNDFSVKKDKLKKTIKVLLKREFPRSNKVRLYAMGAFDPDSGSIPERKKL